MRNRAPVWLRLLVTMFAFTLVAAACVSTDDEEGSDTETETPDETTDEAPEEEHLDQGGDVVEPRALTDAEGVDAADGQHDHGRHVGRGQA